MGMAAILVMWPTSFEHILSPDYEIWLWSVQQKV